MLHAYHHRAHPARRPFPAAASIVAATEEPVAADALDVVDPLDACDAYVVLVLDPETDAVDSYGPLTGPDAVTEAARRRRDLDDGDLDDVVVRVVRHHALHVHG